MIICHCFKVSDREIRLSIDLGATDVEAVGDSCAAGLGCGGCHEAIDKMIADRLAKTAAKDKGSRFSMIARFSRGRSD